MNGGTGGSEHMASMSSYTGLRNLSEEAIQSLGFRRCVVKPVPPSTT